MPTTRIDRDALPYVRPAYEPDTRTLRELLALAGQSRAQAIGRQGDARARGLMTLGEIIGGGLQSFRQERERKEANQAAALRQQREDALKERDQQLREADMVMRAQERQDAAAEKAQLGRETRGNLRAKAIGYGPLSEMDVDTVMQSPERAGDVRYIFGPGTAEGPELQPTPEQRRGIATEQSIQAMGGQIGPNGQVVMPPKPTAPPQPTEWSILMQAAGGDPNKALQLRRQQQAALKQPPAMRSPIWVVGPDGQFQDLAGVAPPGSKPANTREQGRPVISGDANRIADLDTSLNDLVTLRGAVTDPGTITRIQASLPTWVSELTGGWTDDAKSQNAVIARVRQVIGKALEGGVLRKEDEEKYKAILPVIGDSKQVALDKIAGLETALTQRRQTTLDALADAGYDVSRYQARKPSTTTQTGGFIEALDENGELHHAPAGTPLPKGWRLKQ